MKCLTLGEIYNLSNEILNFFITKRGLLRMLVNKRTKCRAILAALDGETMDYSEDYQDTWEEAGFGGSWHVGRNTSLYADVERSFGGNWNKKWQWNICVNWQF